MESSNLGVQVCTVPYKGQNCATPSRIVLYNTRTSLVQHLLVPHDTPEVPDRENTPDESKQGLFESPERFVEPGSRPAM